MKNNFNSIIKQIRFSNWIHDDLKEKAVDGLFRIRYKQEAGFVPKAVNLGAMFRWWETVEGLEFWWYINYCLQAEIAASIKVEF